MTETEDQLSANGRMTVNVSKYFEPVPKLKIEARYKFKWLSDGFNQIDLSMRRNREDRTNSQFDKVEDLPLSEVPDGVVVEAREQLERNARFLGDGND